MEDEDEISHAWNRFMGDPLQELLPRKVEFGEILNSWRIHSWTLFIHKEGQISSWNNYLKCFWFFVTSCSMWRNCKRWMWQFLCNIWKTFTCWQRIIITLRALWSLDGGRHLGASSYWQVWVIANKLTNIDH
jgi:hypothetical protein